MNIYQIIIAMAAMWGAILSSYIAIKNFGKDNPRIIRKRGSGREISQNLCYCDNMTRPLRIEFIGIKI